ncbi:MAG TPA: PDZ domain-containing protein [Planctomycetota bacterium]|nr:PDZ domain-containing protein [Planctomycetota bacterium]
MLLFPIGAFAQDRAEIERELRAEIEKAAKSLAEALQQTVLAPEIHEQFAKQITDIVAKRFEARVQGLERSLAEKDKRIADLEKQVADLRAGARPEGSEPKSETQAERNEPTKAFLGVSHIDDPQGARVTAVLPGGPAAQAGIREGDVITKLGGKSVTSVILSALVTSHPPGSEVPIAIIRGEETMELRAKLANRDELDAAQTREPERSAEPIVLGITVDDGEGTLKVVEIEDELTGKTIGLQVGDIILAFKGQETPTLEALAGLVKGTRSGEEFTIRVRRGGAVLDIRAIGSAGREGAKLVESREVGAGAAAPTDSGREGERTGGRPKLGVAVAETDRGLVIENVFPGTGAAAAGLRRGDLIRKLNGQDVSTVDQVIEVLRGLTPGAEIPVVIARDGSDVTIEKLRLAGSEDPAPEASSAPPPPAESGKPAYLGISAYDDPVGDGVVVRDVLATGPAGAAGIQIGDIIKLFGGQPVANLDALGKALATARPGEKVKLLVRRGERDVEIEVTLGERG